MNNRFYLWLFETSDANDCFKRYSHDDDQSEYGFPKGEYVKISPYDDYAVLDAKEYFEQLDKKQKKDWLHQYWRYCQNEITWLHEELNVILSDLSNIA